MISGSNNSTNLIASEGISPIALEVPNPKERQQLLAGRFHDHMTEGGSFNEASEYRKLFFAEVIDQAEKVGLHYPFLLCEVDFHQVLEGRFSGL